MPMSKDFENEVEEEDPGFRARLKDDKSRQRDGEWSAADRVLKSVDIEVAPCPILD